MWAEVEVMVNIDDILSSRRVGVFSFSLLSDSFRHQPVQGTHVEIRRREPDTVLLQAPEAEPRSKLVEVDECSVMKPDLELLPP